MDGDGPVSKRVFSLALLLILAAGSALAMLPPDAEFREPELRAQRVRARATYEKGIKERQAHMIREDMRVRAEFYTPPWKRTSGGATQQGVAKISNSANNSIESAKNRVLVSIMLFILIGSGVIWAKHATREVDL